MIVTVCIGSYIISLLILYFMYVKVMDECNKMMVPILLKYLQPTPVEIFATYTYPVTVMLGTMFWVKKSATVLVR